MLNKVWVCDRNKNLIYQVQTHTKILNAAITQRNKPKGKL
jgi:hypothetical protein